MPPSGDGKRPFYGLVLDHANSNDEVQHWKPSNELSDLSLPSEEFVPASEFNAAYSELEERYPVPEVKALDVLAVTRISRDGQRVTTSTRPTLMRLDHSHRMSFKSVLATAQAYGGINLAVAGMTGDQYGHTDGSGAWYRAQDLRTAHDENLKYSDVRHEPYKSLIDSDYVFQTLADTNVIALLPDATAAKARRKLAAKRATRARVKEEVERKRVEKVRKRRAKVQARNQVMHDLYNLIDKIDGILVKEVPEVWGTFTTSSCIWQLSSIAALRQRVTIHQHFRGKWAWTKLPLVRELMATVRANRDAFGKRSRDPGYGKLTYKQVGVKRQTNLDAMVWLLAVAETIPAPRKVKPEPMVQRPKKTKLTASTA